jgi:HlyD family secretion protein
MHPEPLRRLVRSLCQAAEPPGGERVGDAELLARFAARRDEAAFELLLWRHGPMVLAVCRRLLANPQDAEDSFQATFLALVRKAGSISRGEAVGGWLYRVAYRVALRARAARSRRSRHEQPGLVETAAPVSGDALGHDFRQVLDEEIDRLPARQRAAFVLCCLEGKTGAEVARQLGCSPGTVSSRLTRARERLRRRLARRGLAPSAGALALLTAPVSSPLVDSTLQAALVFADRKTAAGVLSGRAVSLAEGVLRSMFLTRLRIAALLVLVAGLLVTGGILGRHALKAAPDDPPRQTKAGATAADGAVTVHVVKPRPGGLERVTNQTCDVQAFAQVELDAEVSGRIKSQVVDIGDPVKRGQLLAEIDAPLLALEERQAAAAVQQVKGAVREAEARIRIAQAGVESAASALAQRKAEVNTAQATLSFRQKELARMKSAAEKGSVTERVVFEKQDQVVTAQGQLEAATAAVKTAEAELDIQKSKVAQAEAGLETAKVNLEAARVGLEKAQYTLGLTRIVAPFEGVVTRRNYFVGQYLQPGARGATVPLLTVQRTDLVRVVTQVPENDVPLVHVGLPVKLSFPALPGVRLPDLKVSRIGFVEDPTTRTMRAEIDVANPKQQLRPGMFGTVSIDLGSGPSEALRVPRSANVGGLPVGAVYVVRDGKAYRTEVRFGQSANQEIEVLSGLKPDDLVVTDPGHLKGSAVPVKVTGRPGK